jgi:hypothetical protein
MAVFRANGRLHGSSALSDRSSMPTPRRKTALLVTYGGWKEFFTAPIVPLIKFIKVANQGEEDRAASSKQIHNPNHYTGP